MTEPAAAVESTPPAGARVELLGIAFDAVTQVQAAAAVGALARQAAASLVVTPNVDHVVLLQHDVALQLAYEAAVLRLCDGAPLLALSRLCGRPLPERVTGADLMNDVCAMAAREGLRVFVAGGAPDVLTRGMSALRAQHPGLEISGSSPPLAFEGTPAEDELLRTLAEQRPHIVMVCLGAPRAETWAVGQLGGHPAVYLCVGAAIDFAAGARSRAPRWMQRSGLEWAYRLGQEPGRLWRRYLVRDAAFLPLALRELWRCRRAPRDRRGGPRP